MTDDMNRKLAIKHFFESAGYAIFSEELENLKLGFTSDADKLVSNPVNVDVIGTFNFNLGLIAGLNRVLYILEAMKEDLESDSAPDEA